MTKQRDRKRKKTMENENQPTFWYGLEGRRVDGTPGIKEYWNGWKEKVKQSGI